MPATRLPIIGYPLPRTVLEGVLRRSLAAARPSRRMSSRSGTTARSGSITTAPRTVTRPAAIAARASRRDASRSFESARSRATVPLGRAADRMALSVQDAREPSAAD